MNIDIAKAVYEEIDAIKKIAAQHLYTKHFSFFGYCNRDKFASGDILKASVDGKIVGFVVLSHNRRMSQTEIDIIGVDEVWRSKGIGTLFIDYIMQTTPKLVLFVQNDNIDAIRFYKRNGFRLALATGSNPREDCIALMKTGRGVLLS